jgi:serine/threonine protein kinase
MSLSAVRAVLAKGAEILTHIRASYIFRSTLGYLAAQLEPFLACVSDLCAQSSLTDAQVQALHQLQALFNDFAQTLSHLSESEWLEPALNWPVRLIHADIDRFRNTTRQAATAAGLAGTFFSTDADLDSKNRRADFHLLKAVLQSHAVKVNVSDTVGVQQQIEAKLNEVLELFPRQGKKRPRRPSNEASVTTMKNKVQGLLEQFASINIEDQDLRIINQIGAGGFGSVWKAIRLSTSEIVAVKELRDDRLTVFSWASLYSEVLTMASARHPFVLELVGVHIKEPFRIITSFCQGKSLFDRLHHPNPDLRRLPTTQLTKIAYQVACGMRFLHGRGIVHRDLKTLNILLDEFDDAYVADFGLCAVMHNNQDLVGGVGTPHYTAPEVLQHLRYNEKIDVYSYGLILWELLTRKVPYTGMKDMAIFDHVVNRNWRLPIPKETPAGLRKAISRCWSRNANDRPPFDEIVMLFEKGDIIFPDAATLDLGALSRGVRCPPLDLEYAFKVLGNPEHPRFSSVCDFITRRIDARTREQLRQGVCFSDLVKATGDVHSVLLLASVLMDAGEIESFWTHGGHELFHKVLEGNCFDISSAIRFALVLPDARVCQIVDALPQIIAGACTQSLGALVQLFARFPIAIVKRYSADLRNAMTVVSGSDVDNATFRAITTLFPVCSGDFSASELRAFHGLIRQDFNVPPSFLSALLETVNDESYSSLILNAFKAAERSDIGPVLIAHLKTSRMVSSIWRNPDFVPILIHCLHTSAARFVLFLVFCIADDHEAADFLTESALLGSIVHMKGLQIQRMQILTALSLREIFCERTPFIDGIVHFLVSAIGVEELEDATYRLIAAMSQHRAGCGVLTENGILEIVAQRFLSLSASNSPIIHRILRNVAGNQVEIPQGSLIVSCLMQELFGSRDGAVLEILGTVTKMVEIMPGSIQEHDVHRIVASYMRLDAPPILRSALKLITALDVSVLRTLAIQIFGVIFQVFQRPEMLFPDLVVAAINAIMVLQLQLEFREALERVEFRRFVGELAALFPRDDPRIMSLRECQAVLYESDNEPG